MQALSGSFPGCRHAAVAGVLLVVAVSTAVAGTWWAVAPETDGSPVTLLPQAPQVVVSRYDEVGLQVTVDLRGMELDFHRTAASQFVLARWPEASLAGEIGTPALPVVRRIVVVPDGATVTLDVDEGLPTVIDLAAAGFDAPIIPRQPAIGMDADPREEAQFHYDPAAYAVDGTLPAERATISELGIMRGHHLHLLEVRPVAYNPARGTLTAWPHINVSVNFVGEQSQPGRGWLPALSDMLLNPPPASGPFGWGLGNYLVIVAEAYAGTAPMSQFIVAKKAEGFRVMTYTVPPGTSNTAIKDYIESLWGTPDAPDYILLVGDTDTVPHWTGGGNKRAATDLPYACMDPGDDWYPDIAIGRFSVRSEGDLQVMVDKTLFVAAQDYPDPNYVKRAVFMATSDMSSGGEETHDWVIENIMDPAEFESIKIYARLGGGTSDIFNAFNRGCVMGVYFGHSDSTGWWGPPFSQSNVRSLSNAGKYPAAVTSFSCNVGKYTNPECFGETWLRVENKGAAGVIFPSTYIYWTDPPWHEASNLQKFFYQSVIVDEIREVSPAWQAALVLLVDLYGPNEPACRDYSEMYNLMGDPSLRVPEPSGFRLSVDPLSQSVCAPPTDEVVYDIEVQETGDFDEPVTLTASGAPPGASVSFSVNSLPPPFSSVMTVANIIPGSPGQYDIEVTGTAPSLVHSVFVRLNLSDSLPGDVTLTSPPDGATEVSREPTLEWKAASQAAEYDLEIATDAGFLNVVYSATETATQHTVGEQLDAAMLYYWHVRAVNGCGDGDFCPAFSFTTVEQPDYFTEQFTNDFDLDYFGASFIPDGSFDFYEMCGGPIAALPTDPAGGTVLSLGEDRYEQVWLADNRTVTLYGLSYTNFYVGSNGYITFGAGDTDWTESLDDHFDLPRISLLFDDLSPQNGGPVSWKQLEDRAAVTYENVPEYGTSNSNTFQVEMFFEGKIRISWLRIDSNDSIVGLSEGLGVPGDFIETDVSASDRCCRGDFNGDGQIDLADLATLLANYPTPSGALYEDGDFDEDGDIDLSDLAALLAVYGTTCP